MTRFFSNFALASPLIVASAMLAVAVVLLVVIVAHERRWFDQPFARGRLRSGKPLSFAKSALIAAAFLIGLPAVSFAAYNGAVNFAPFLAAANTFTGAQTFGSTTTSAATITTATATTATIATANLTRTTYTPLVLTTGASYTMDGTKHDIYVKKSTGSATAITLPASPAAGDEYYIKDAKGDAPTNPITVSPASGTIDGGSSFVMSANTYQGNHFHYNGTEWSVD